MLIKTLILLSYLLALSWIGTHKVEAATLPEDEGMFFLLLCFLGFLFDGIVLLYSDSAESNSQNNGSYKLEF